MGAPPQGREHSHLQGQELCLKVHWHPVSHPPHQLHVRPGRFPLHLHAPDQEVDFHHFPPSTIHHPPSTINHQPSTIHHPTSTIHHPSCITYLNVLNASE